MRIIIIYAFHFYSLSAGIDYDAYVFDYFTQEENILWLLDILVSTVLQVCSSYTCMCVCTERFELSLLHPPPPRKQTWHPRVYTHIAAWDWARYIKYPYKK